MSNVGLVGPDVDGFVAFSTGTNGTLGWLQSDYSCFGNQQHKDYPGSIKYGLFGVAMGRFANSDGFPANGGRRTNTSFRPVIWN